MNAWDELVARCAQRRREKIGPLSDQAFEELLLAVRERPADFVDSPSEQALLELARALDAYRASRQDDDLLDDDAFRAARERRLLALASACDRAAAIDEGCLDARLVALLAREEDPDALLGFLVELERGASAPVPEGGGDAWDDVWCRPRLRLRAAIARTCLDGARHRMARTAAASLLAASPRDELGARPLLCKGAQAVQTCHREGEAVRPGSLTDGALIGGGLFDRDRQGQAPELQLHVAGDLRRVARRAGPEGRQGPVEGAAAQPQPD